MIHKNFQFRGIKMARQIVKCPNKKCGREIVTEKKIDIQCRGCGQRFDL